MHRQLAVLLFFLGSVLGFVAPTSAQNPNHDPEVFGLFLLLPIELPVISKEALNQQLAEVGLPPAEHPTSVLGFGGQLYMNRFISRFSFNKGTRETDRATSQTAVEYRATSLNFGYDLSRNPWFSLYPYLGFKGSGLNYRYQEKLGAETPFTEYLQTDLTYKEITNSRAHLDLGMGISHQWFYLFDLRFGYLVPIEKVSWRMNNNQLDLRHAPQIAYQFYFTLTFGLGGIGRDEEGGRRSGNDVQWIARHRKPKHLAVL